MADQQDAKPILGFNLHTEAVQLADGNMGVKLQFTVTLSAEGARSVATGLEQAAQVAATGLIIATPKTRPDRNGKGPLGLVQ